METPFDASRAQSTRYAKPLMALVLLLTACGGGEATTTEPVTTTSSTSTTKPLPMVTRDGIALPASFPTIDTSTARIPITNALFQLFTRTYRLEGPEPLASKTHGAWLNLADGVADLIFAVLPTDEEVEYLDERDVDIEVRLYGCDGLVFLGNVDNPVDNLTPEQIKGIYRGEIRNWKDLGGPDHEIVAFYRDSQSGSQRFFESLVWAGETPPDFEGIGLYMEDDMSDVTWDIIENPYAIGFNIMSYVDMEFRDPRLKLISVNGVAPSTATLADGTYAYITQAYLIIRADEPADSPARWLFNWFGSEESITILEENSELSIIFGDPKLVRTSEGRNELEDIN